VGGGGGGLSEFGYSWILHWILCWLLQENIKTLVSYIVEHFMSTLEAVEYVDTFKGLKLRNEQAMDAENEPPPAM